ncbi:DUF4167 domain-containing protein [Polymorphum gilvum]|uniref:DUF4167 domain-containing protein n=1 Tax=Polymorphum gilvum TaxID=991904 RepID=UPI00031C15B9|nr:DUF4167 domain-containing protein [Polymorphum gilvum]
MRSRGRKGPNPLSRAYESNGPDVKIRGTALHIAEKYQQLARDAQASGDRVMSENYFQHAEHYYRIVAAAQPNLPAGSPGLRFDNGQDEDDLELATPERSERSDRPERSERTDRPERQDRRDRPERSERPERTERPERLERPARHADLVTTDSPQPFIDHMPGIDLNGNLNGHAVAEVAEHAGADVDDQSEGDETKPRRRLRGTRGRGMRRTGDGSPETQAQGSGGPDEDAPAGDGGDEAPKARARRTPRPRRAKDAEGDAEAVAAGDA